jgi:hypothetical protein
MPNPKPTPVLAPVRPVRPIGPAAARPAAPAALLEPGALRMAPDARLAAELAEAERIGLDRLTDAYIEELAEALLARLAAIQADRQAAAAQSGAAAGVVWAAHGRDNAEEVADLRERVKGVREVIVQRQGWQIDD